MAVALSAWSCDRPTSSVERAAASASPARRPLADPARCETLKLRYEAARASADTCKYDDECAVEARGELHTGLDGCFRLSNHKFDGSAADRVAQEWLDEGCASSFELCPVSRSSAICRAGVCRERPPPPTPEDWERVDIDATLTLFLPPELVERSFQRTCGNGPALRLFHAAGLEVRIEYGHELGYLPLTDEVVEGPAPVRLVARSKRTIAPYEATLLSFHAPQLSSRQTAPDGSWPRYSFVQALWVAGIDPRGGAGALKLGMGSGTGPVALAVSIEGARASEHLAARIFATVSFW